jgi:hypothetical protein
MMVTKLAALAPLALEGNGRMAAAILMGIAFGIILVKSDFPYSKQVREALTLKNGELSKSFLLSLGIGTLLFYFLYKTGVVTYHVRPAYLWPSILGGIVAGIGMALCMAVPVTVLASLASGKLYALWAILGMILAVPCVRIASEWLSGTIFQWGQKMNDPEHYSEFFSFSNPALWVLMVCAVLVLILQFALSGGSSSGGGSGDSGGDKKKKE